MKDSLFWRAFVAQKITGKENQMSRPRQTHVGNMDEYKNNQ